VLIAILLLYSSQFFFPANTYRESLQSAFQNDLIASNVTERTPTGWGSDKATECLSLGMGLKQIDNFNELLLNFYPGDPKTYNPCSGLRAWTYETSTEYEFSSYARYWHGHAEMIRWLVLATGIPIARSILWIVMFILIFCLWLVVQASLRKCSKRPQVIATFTVGIYAYFSGLSDLHSSMTHLLSEISILFIALLSYKILGSKPRGKIMIYGFTMGGAYVCTSYMINPQSIPVAILVWATIPIVLRTRELKKTILNSIVLISSLVVGFICLWVTKWLLIWATGSYDIWTDVRSQALHRSSHSVNSLSDGVGKHLESFRNLPAFLQAILANVAALLSKIYDPRYSSDFLLIFYLITAMSFAIFVTWKWRTTATHFDFTKFDHLANGVLLIWISSLSLVMFWYIFLTQHSFDHATYTYRSLAIGISGIPMVLASLLGHENVQNEKSLYDAR
jgi:hypothetical protein